MNSRDIWRFALLSSLSKIDQQQIKQTNKKIGLFNRLHDSFIFFYFSKCNRLLILMIFGKIRAWSPSFVTASDGTPNFNCLFGFSNAIIWSACINLFSTIPNFRFWFSVNQSMATSVNNIFMIIFFFSNLVKRINNNYYYWESMPY